MPRVSSQAISFKQDTPSAKWTIVHNLGCRPHVTVLVNYDEVLQQILPKDIRYVDLNTVEVIFTTEYTGSARLS